MGRLELKGKFRLKQFRSAADQMSNLTLLDARENVEKNAKPFEKWISTPEPAFLKRHLIPEEKPLWRTEAFPDFLQERSRLKLDRLFEVLKA